MSLAEITKLLELPGITTLHGLRDRAILELFYSTATRSSDARALQVTDINLTDLRRVHAKPHPPSGLSS